MSAYVSGSVIKHSRSSGSAFAVLLIIADCAGDDGIALPKWDTSVATLAKKARLSPRTVQYAIRELESLGELVVEVHNGKHANTYQILLDRNYSLFEGPGAPAAEPTADTAAAQRDRLSLMRKSVDKSGDESSTGVHTIAGEGCNPASKGVQTVAPNPSSHHYPLKPLPPGKPAAVSEPVDKSKSKNRPEGPEGMQDWVPGGSTIAFIGGLGHGPYLALHLEHFRNYVSEPRIFKKYRDLDRAFKNAVLGDWGGVRATAQAGARRGGVDLARWWASSDGVAAKGALLGLQRTGGDWRAYEKLVIVEATRREGWGAWVDAERQPLYHRWAKESLELSGA